tara:strand:- start:1005 stop:1844 length:840 start_codon:yes stop_codon:yes gene_type:complete
MKTRKPKHNKKRNTAFLFETLIKEMAKSVISKDEERHRTAAQIVKKHFARGTALYEELQLYKAILETKEATEDIAKRVVLEATLRYNNINRRNVFAEQSDLIRQINYNLGSEVYSNFVPSYKNIATVAQMFSNLTPVAEKVLLENKVVEFMVRKEQKLEPEALEPIDNLVFKTFANKFNEQYSGKLTPEQREVLMRFVYSMSDNGVSLKSYLNEEIQRLRGVVLGSRELVEVKSDNSMLAKTEKVVEFLDSLQQTPLSEEIIKKILKVQELASEVTSNG